MDDIATLEELSKFLRENNYVRLADTVDRLLTKRVNKTCSKCAFWSPDKHRISGLGVCSRVLVRYQSTWDDDYNRVLSPEYADRKFFAQDGSDYHAEVLTAPTFFCAEFSPQPPKATADE